MAVLILKNDKSIYFHMCYAALTENIYFTHLNLCFWSLLITSHIFIIGYFYLFHDTSVLYILVVDPCAAGILAGTPKRIFNLCDPVARLNNILYKRDLF